MCLCLYCALSILGVASPGAAQQAPAPTGPEAIKSEGQAPSSPQGDMGNEGQAPGAAIELPPVKIIVTPPEAAKKRPAVTAGSAAKGKPQAAANAASEGQVPMAASS